MKRWAVVQDLRPFGLRVEGRYRYHWRARLKANGSRYLRVLPLGYVDAENARLEDPDEVMSDIHAGRRPSRLVALEQRQADIRYRQARAAADKLIPRFAAKERSHAGQGGGQ